MALSDNGKAYSWGLNLLGQLGHGDTEPRWSPTPIQGIEDSKIVIIASGAGQASGRTAVQQGVLVSLQGGGGCEGGRGWLLFRAPGVPGGSRAGPGRFRTWPR